MPRYLLFDSEPPRQIQIEHPDRGYRGLYLRHQAVLYPNRWIEALRSSFPLCRLRQKWQVPALLDRSLWELCWVEGHCDWIQPHRCEFVPQAGVQRRHDSRVGAGVRSEDLGQDNVDDYSFSQEDRAGFDFLQHGVADPGYHYD
jgi:hypothetical protein